MSSSSSSSSSASSAPAEPVVQPFLPDFLSILCGCNGDGEAGKLFSADRIKAEAAKVELSLAALTPGLMRAPAPLHPPCSVLEPVLAFLRDLRFQASELHLTDLEQLSAGPRLYRVALRCSFECVRIMRARTDQMPFALATISLLIDEIERWWHTEQQRMATSLDSPGVKAVRSYNPFARAIIPPPPTRAVEACIEEMMHTVTTPALRGDEAAHAYALSLVRRFGGAFSLDRVVENLLAGCSCAVLLHWLLQEDDAVLRRVGWKSHLSKLHLRSSATSTAYRLCVDITHKMLRWQTRGATAAAGAAAAEDVPSSSASTASSAAPRNVSADHATAAVAFVKLRQWLAEQQRSLPGQLLWPRVLLMLLERRPGCFPSIRRMLLPGLRFDAVRLKLDEVDHRQSGLPRAGEGGRMLSALVNGLSSSQARAELSDGKEDAEALLDLLHRKLVRMTEEQLEATGALTVLHAFFPSLIDVPEGAAAERIVVLLITRWNARADRLRTANPSAISAPAGEPPLPEDRFRWQWHALSAQCGPAGSASQHCALLDLARMLLSLGLTRHIDVLTHLTHSAGPLHPWLTGNRYRRTSTGRCDWIVPDFDLASRAADDDAPRPCSILEAVSSGCNLPRNDTLTTLAIAVSEWMGSCYPQLRALIEEPLIPDLAQLVLEYVTPNRAQLGLDAFAVGQ